MLRVVKKTGSKFAIRSGGHNFNPGFSGMDSYGIVLDLQDLNSLHLDAERTLQVGAGNTWGTVYKFLNESGLSAVGGRQNNVGVSGYLLGGKCSMSINFGRTDEVLSLKSNDAGGMPPFPSLYGLGADNVKNYEVGCQMPPSSHMTLRRTNYQLSGGFGRRYNCERQRS